MDAKKLIEPMTLETAKELTAMAKEGKCAFTVPALIANCNWLIERVESQQQEIDRLKAENEKLRELAYVTVNIRFPEKCYHGEEPWYCDRCKHEWESSVIAAVAKAREVLGE